MFWTCLDSQALHLLSVGGGMSCAHVGIAGHTCVDEMVLTRAVGEAGWLDGTCALEAFLSCS